MTDLVPSYLAEERLHQDLMARIPALYGPFTREEIHVIVDGVIRGDALSDIAERIAPSASTIVQHFCRGAASTPLLVDLYDNALALRADKRLSEIGVLATEAAHLDKDDVPAANLRLKALTTLIEKEDPRRYGRNAGREDSAAEMIAKEVVKRWVVVPEKELPSGDSR